VTVRSDIPTWLGAEPDEDADRSERRQRRLLVVAVAPWLIVLALVLSDRAPGTPAGEPGAHAEAGTSQAGGGPAAQPDLADELSSHHQADGELPAPQAGRPEPDARTRIPGSIFDPASSAVSSRDPDPRGAAALAIVIARAWLTDVSPRLPLPGIEPAGGDRYAEHLVVEAVESPSSDAAVATVLAVLLEEGDPLSTRVKRIAVPLALDPDGIRPGGQPWWLPPPDLTVRDLRTTPVDDPVAFAAATDALTRAGYLDVVVESLSASPGWPTRAIVRAMTPDGEQVAGPIWLRRHADGYAVAGTTPSDGPGREPDRPLTAPEPDSGPGASTPDPDPTGHDPDPQEPAR
jgi:hypothetical protein